MSKENNIITKIAASGLVGRGGASYPTARKWAAVQSALKNKKQGYIIVNAAEGEPGVKKDGYILKHHAVELVDGIYLADRFLGSKKIKKVYLFLNHKYYQEYGPGLKKVLAVKKYQTLKEKIEFFIKPEKLTYISGEETALLNLIEGKKVEPRLKPPYPTEHGLFGRPTLINNPETFYDVSLVAAGRYEGERFYTFSGALKRRGVYALPANLSIEEVLRRTGNYPDQPFFVSVGGEASGEVFASDQLMGPVEGAGLIMVYDLEKTDEQKLLRYWLNFYKEQSCGHCTICREGTYRLLEMLNKRDNFHGAGKSRKEFDWDLFWEIVAGLEESSFCALGASLPIPLRSYWKNIVKQKKSGKLS
jgi:NADH:ubiquinone oxidoreductase subunit F (NADH-binding)